MYILNCTVRWRTWTNSFVWRQVRVQQRQEIQTLMERTKRYQRQKRLQSLLTKPKYRSGGHSLLKTPPAQSPPCGPAAQFGAAGLGSGSGSTPQDSAPPPPTQTGTAQTHNDIITYNYGEHMNAVFCSLHWIICVCVCNTHILQYFITLHIPLNCTWNWFIKNKDWLKADWKVMIVTNANCL